MKMNSRIKIWTWIIITEEPAGWGDGGASEQQEFRKEFSKWKKKSTKKVKEKSEKPTAKSNAHSKTFHTQTDSLYIAIDVVSAIYYLIYTYHIHSSQ